MDNRVVVITGASAGIGATLAQQLAAQGDSVTLVARREDALREVASHCGPHTLVVSADVGQRDAVRRVVDTTLTRFGRIDVWVNNAGQGITRMPSALTDEDVDEMMRVNVKSALYGMQEVLPHFKDRRRGHVINISSMLGRVPFATHRSAYSASKHYLNALTAMFRDELKADYPDIVFSTVSPGVVHTEFGLRARFGGADSRQLPGQSQEDVAAVIAGVIASRVPDQYTYAGARSQVVGYYSQIGLDPQ